MVLYNFPQNSQIYAENTNNAGCIFEFGGSYERFDFIQIFNYSVKAQ